MPFAIRLRERNKQAGHMKRTYTSAHKGRKYVAGEGSEPSDWTVESDLVEVREVAKDDQFEVVEFRDIAEMRQRVEDDAQARARMGFPLIYARVTGDLTEREFDQANQHGVPAGTTLVPAQIEEPMEDLAPPVPKTPAPRRDDDPTPMGRSGGRKPAPKAESTPAKKTGGKKATGKAKAKKKK